MTRDGGGEWQNVTPRGAGRGLINSIDVSPHDPGTAYVVAMKYKEGDNRPYIFRTENYGRSWDAIVDGIPPEHFARVVREDPQRPGLLYAGTERGLYVSFNAGDDWQALKTNLPVVPITDLMVRRNDLVLATQGRAFWVVDDIAPLRQFSTQQQSAAAHLYDPSPAYRLTPTRGGNGGGESFAPSAPDGAVIYYALAEEPDLEDESLSIEIMQGETVVRTLTANKDVGAEGGGANASYSIPAQKGINRAIWDLRHDATPSVDYPFLFGAARDDDSIRGHSVRPGTYRVRLNAGGEQLESTVRVQWDPINSYDSARINEQQTMLEDLRPMISSLYRRINSLLAIKEQLELRKTLAEKSGNEGQAADAGSLLEALENWQKSVTTPDRKTNQDVLNFAPRVDAFLVNLYQQVDDAVLGITAGQVDRFADLQVQWRAAIDGWQDLIEDEVEPFIERAGPAVLVPEWE